MIISDTHYRLLGLMRPSRKGMTGAELQEVEPMDNNAIYMRLKRMVEHGWLERNEVGREVRHTLTPLGRLAHDYAKAERGDDGS